jgi:pyridoxamine 5'-phosphate oxidase
MTDMPLADVRKEYMLHGLSESEVDADPISQFQTWLDAAIAAGHPEPTAMTVATATLDGAPSARMTLLKGLDERGFVFYTNYESRKGRELAENPRAALAVLWKPLDRQVRLEGPVERLSAEESDAYFATRGRGSRLGAWASKQSTEIPGRETLDAALADADGRYPDDVPRPEYWGGFLLRPDVVEFWEGRADRLHDRQEFRREGTGWRSRRLSP